MSVAKLAGPLIISRFGDLMASFFFLSFVGHCLPESLSYASFAWALVSFTTVVGIGLFSVVMIDAASIREDDGDKACILLVTGLKVAITVGFSIFGVALGYLTIRHGVAELLQPPSGGVWMMLLSMPAIYCQIVIFNYFNAIGHPKYEVRFVWVSNLIFILAGLWYVYAEASISFLLFVLVYVLLRWVLIFLMLLYAVCSAKKRCAISIFLHLRCAKILRFIIDGLPMALCYAGESFLYFALSLISSALGGVALSAYQASLHFLSLIYMISIGVGNAVAIQVARSASLKGVSTAKRTLLEGLRFGGLLIAPCLIVCAFLSGYVAKLYTSDPLVASSISSAIKISVPFLIFEFVYVVFRMALRSLGDSWVPTLATICCLNGVGLFSTWFLLRFYEQSLISIFSAITICALILMLFLMYRFLKIYRKKQCIA